MGVEVDIENPESLGQWLRGRGFLSATDSLVMRVLQGGVSNRAVLIRLPSGEAWVLKQSLSRLRVAVEWFSSRDRIFREAHGIRWLSELAPAGTVPRLILVDAENFLLAMEAVPDPHETWKGLLLRGVIRDAHVKQFGRLLGTIHGRAAMQHSELAEVFADRSFFESLRIEPYYTYTSGILPETSEFYRELIHETRRHVLTIVHGDYSPKNILIFQDRLILIDHEVIHCGDPAFDVGFSLTHLLSKAHHLPEQRQALIEAALLYWRTYIDVLGDVAWREELEGRVVRHTLGCLLARARGRSPLEYLSECEREHQAAEVLRLLRSCPKSVSELAGRWMSGGGQPL